MSGTCRKTTMRRASTLSAAGIGAALATLSQTPAALAQPAQRYWGPDMMWGGWFHMFFGFVMMILFLGIIVVVIVLGVRWLGSSEHSPFRHPPGRDGDALDILKKRLAKGEIDVAEFEERRRALGE
jgi:putative membrane protein